MCFFLKEIDIYFYRKESILHADMKIGLIMSYGIKSDSIIYIRLIY